jgi:PIN domain nuclease of toxin-antitoxin system
MLSSQILVSAASLWEISIKVGTGQLELTAPLEHLVADDLSQHGIEILPLHASHLRKVAELPFPNNGHRDPFDRLLVAQAMVERLDLVSADSALDAYSVARVW